MVIKALQERVLTLPALPTTSCTKLRLVKSVNLEQDGHEDEQISRRTDHWLSQAG